MAPPHKPDHGDMVTQLNALLDEVLMAIKNTAHLKMKRPQLLPLFHMRCMDKFCEFH